MTTRDMWLDMMMDTTPRGIKRRRRRRRRRETDTLVGGIE